MSVIDMSIHKESVEELHKSIISILQESYKFCDGGKTGRKALDVLQKGICNDHMTITNCTFTENISDK